MRWDNLAHTFTLIEYVKGKAMPWLRKVRVTINNEDGDPNKRIIFEDHRIDFAVRSTIGWPADTADVTLYNLSIQEVKSLQDKNFGNFYITIEATYIDRLESGSANKNSAWTGVNVNSSTDKSAQTTVGGETIFRGRITNAVGYKSPPNHITKLFCISEAYMGSTTFKQMKDIPAGSTLKQAITSMCSDYGFTTISQFGVSDEDLSVKLKRPRVFHDTFLIELRNLLGEYNLLYTMTTNEIQIFPETYGDKDAVDRMAKDRDPIKLDANMVIGNPMAGICTFRLNTFLNGTIQPGMILDVSPLLGTEILANGVVAVNGPVLLNTDNSVFKWAMEDKYVIMEVVHHGSTHDTDFMTSISAVIGGNTDMGKNEMAWQDMYAQTGMGDEVW